MMGLVKVYHNEWVLNEAKTKRLGTKKVLVAEVHVPGGTKDPLDYAYRWTNNINGSWSTGVTKLHDGNALVDNSDNSDYNVNVTIVADLPVVNGRTLGLRSTSVDDVMEIEGIEWEVADFGFHLKESI